MLHTVQDVDVDLSQVARLGNEILAKISKVREADPIFPELLRRYEPEMLDERLNFGHSLGFRGVEALNIRLHRR
jgi:hypothetical protein